LSSAGEQLICTNDGFVCATGSTGTYTQAYAVCASKVPNNS
jgi:hypothetical protein